MPNWMRAGARHRRRLPWPVVVVALAASSACGDAPTGPGDSRVEPVAQPADVRGLYVNARAAGSPAQLAGLLGLVDSSAVNTFVVDVKERGEVSYASTVPVVAQVGSGRDFIPDPLGLLRALREHGIYPVARIVVFSDPVLAAARPDLSIRTTSGGVWLDPESGLPWVDPYNPDVWAYNIALAREALDAGFAEVQWDYVRFPDVSDSVRATMVFPAHAGRTAREAIEGFVAASRIALAGFGVPITADVFGRVITSPDDSGIGQQWDGMLGVTDVLLPMVYPSLYGAGSFGIPDPAAAPYTLVRTALDSAVARTARAPSGGATIRPWLQAFSLGGAVYGPQQLLDQLRAVEDAGLTEWLFWNPDAIYPSGVF